MPAWPTTAERGAHRSSAFTLVEVMVSTAILLVLLGLFSFIITNGGSACRRNLSGIERSSNGRAACEFIRREMAAALLPANRGDTRNLQFVVNPPGIGSAYGCRDAVFWQAPIATAADMGEIAEVGYFVQWDLSDAARPRPSLCRFFVNPTDTANFLIYTNPLNWIGAQAIANVASATAATSPPYQGLLTENVVGLWVSCLDAYGSPIVQAGGGFDSRLGYTDSAGAAHPACSLPFAVDLSFVALDSGTTRRIDAALYSAVAPLVRGAAGAGDFVSQARGSAALAPLRAGFRPFTIRILLRNAS